MRHSAVVSESVLLYVIYDHPKDFPNHWVVRRWTSYLPVSLGPGVTLLGKKAKPEPLCFPACSLEEARKVVPKGAVQVPKEDHDDPCIAEIWSDER